ncbi:1-phosphatidylinositol-3-phosphate 5-kinase Fab1 [Schizosaccharomyces cryophilus OY26]|uniref:1-phosphatidylinositol-3-phosphate 5-kinase n=1 Tax=Schizosaccharomyces cryophilus (strain OY26 / ATCC MYA-4695 / CBS 11777 / NBRC 106824 / NRRL Y48691) TaxID=653667 RepID=S9W829_SCHCR|nr:1-phosphatidylinositol-3-phosphate 5-kinase Fab1 [Schizosaccharomyces cryophilus OY26]EPY53865.1 1-phosphatidylinositol-3-phosphate 5-kinase Fab1 [Schizosaccharomyces cryophilus OY26]
MPFEHSSITSQFKLQPSALSNYKSFLQHLSKINKTSSSPHRHSSIADEPKLIIHPSSQMQLSDPLLNLQNGNLSREFWMRDERTTKCSLCEAEFSFFRRKHHCRICGKIFCSKCLTKVSGEIYNLPREIKVCLPCASVSKSSLLSRYSHEERANPYIGMNIPMPFPSFLEESSNDHVLSSFAEYSNPYEMPVDVRPPDITPMIAIPSSRSSYKSPGWGHRSIFVEWKKQNLSPQQFNKPISQYSPLNASIPRDIGSSVVSMERSSSNPLLQNGTYGHMSPLLNKVKRMKHSPAVRFSTPSMNGERCPSKLPLNNNRSPGISFPNSPPSVKNERFHPTHEEEFYVHTPQTDTDLNSPKFELYSNFEDSDDESLFNNSMIIPFHTNYNSSARLQYPIANSTNVNPHSSADSCGYHLNPFISLLKFILPSSLLQSGPPSPPQCVAQLLSSQTDNAISSGEASPRFRARSRSSSHSPSVPAPWIIFFDAFNDLVVEFLKRLLLQMLLDANVEAPLKWVFCLPQILLKTSLNMSPDIPAGDDIDVRSGQPNETFYIPGILFTKKASSKSMDRPVQKPRIALLSFSLDYDCNEQRILSLDSLMNQQEEYVYNLVSRICTLKPTLVFIKDDIPAIALKYFEEHGVVAICGIKETVMYDIARCCHADIISSIDKLSLRPRLGTCGQFQLRSYVIDEKTGIRKTFAILDHCSERLGCTVVLRGGSYEELTKVKRIVEISLLATYHLKLESCMLRDKFVNMTELLSSAHNMMTPIEDFMEKLGVCNSEPSHSKQLEDQGAENYSHHNCLDSDTTNATIDFSFNRDFDSHSDIEVNFPAVDDYASIKSALLERITTFSPFIKRPLPRLLGRVYHLQTLENIYLTKLNSDYPNSYLLNFMNEFLGTLHHGDDCQLAYNLLCTHERLTFLQKQWELYYSRSQQLFSPLSNQRMVVLYSIINKETSVPCIGPERCLLEFYRESDCTLGQFIESTCLNTNVSCGGEYCPTKDMLSHYKSYVHGNGRISVVLEEFTCPISGLEEKIVLWNYCRSCQRNTPVTVMSDETWRYSFGKYLEFMFYNDDIKDRFDFCNHSIMHDHVHYFGYVNLAVRFQRDPIEIFELFVPQVMLYYNPIFVKNQKDCEYFRLKKLIEKCLSSVTTRINQLRTDWVTDPAKLQSCEEEIASYRLTLTNDHNDLYSELDSIYQNTSIIDFLSMNSVLRILQGRMIKWEQRFTDYQRLYLPSYKEISRLAATQIKKVFLARSVLQQPSDPMESLDSAKDLVVPHAENPSLDDDSKEEKKELSHTRSESAISIDVFKDNESLGSSLRSVFPVMESGTERKYSGNSPKSPTKPENTESHSFPVSPSTSRNKTSCRSSSEQSLSESFDKKRHNSILSSPTSKDYLSDGLRNPVSSAISARISSMQRSTKPITRKIAPTKDARVSCLVRQFEELSQQLQEKRRRDDELVRARRKRTMPVAPSKPVVEVFSDLSNAFEDEEASDDEANELEKKEMNDIRNVPNRETKNVKEDEDTSYDTFEDIFGVLFKNEPDLGERQTPESFDNRQNVSKEDLRSEFTGPYNDKTSLYKILSTFWSEWNSLNPLPFEFPLQASEHIFSDSNVVIREDEPSSLISFTLNSPDYINKMVEIENNMDNFLFESASQPTLQDKIENLMLKPTGTHLKYQFEEGSANLSCKVFFAEQFSALRRACDVADSFVSSLSRCSVWESSGGKSGSAFLKTFDERYVMKVVSRLESDSLLSFAPAYFDYMSKVVFHELPTTLTKIFGFYHVDIRNPSTGKVCKLDIMVMENLFYDKKPSRIFDLKGSMRNRHVQSTGKVNEVLLDENLVELIYESPIFVSEQLKSLLQSSLWNDTLFLSKLNIMDYSLVVGIDYEKRELYVGIIDFIRTYTWDKKLESWVKEKGLVGRGPEPTIVTPKQYKIRFRKAMDCYILASQDFEVDGGNEKYD